MKPALFILLLLYMVSHDAAAQADAKATDEAYRPQIHFSPKTHWTNDPNGMVYHNGVYHLFYQFHPYSSVWGPMHWGHATSKDLVHWSREPIALFPDSLGAIFSGSAVVDKNNTSGFGKNGQVPLVAIFTQHDPKGEKAGRNDFQNQSLAYSLDNGKTWMMYNRNPVLKNPGITDFRDPKVIWYEPQRKWLMTLAVKDRISFYSSPDLKEWKKESDFGKELGAHGGVWECPDLFALDHNGKKVWILIVSINPGGPNKGSATQYFVGDFDGSNFTASHKDIRWIDYGPDNYAGITWSNTGNRKIFIGWMSNWMYANDVPTTTWRNAMTVPRDITLKEINNELYVASRPVPELAKIQAKPVVLSTINAGSNTDISKRVGGFAWPCRISLAMDDAKDISLVIGNDQGEEISIGFDKNANQYFIDRSKAGQSVFNKEFAIRHVAPRIATGKKMKMTVIIDASSVEVFADEGLTVMTSVFFPKAPYNNLHVRSADNAVIKKLEFSKLKNIWP